MVWPLGREKQREGACFEDNEEGFPMVGEEGREGNKGEVGSGLEGEDGRPIR